MSLALVRRDEFEESMDTRPRQLQGHRAIVFDLGSFAHLKHLSRVNDAQLAVGCRLRQSNGFEQAQCIRIEDQDRWAAV